MSTAAHTADAATAEIILGLLAAGPYDFAQIRNSHTHDGILRRTSGLVLRATLDDLEAAGTVTCSGGFETYRLA